jgi:hypothetical protein
MITFCRKRYLSEDVRVAVFPSYIWQYVFHRKHEDRRRGCVVWTCLFSAKGKLSLRNTKIFDFRFP